MTSNRKNKRIIRNHMEKTGLNFLEAKLQLEASGAISKPGDLRPSIGNPGELLDLSPGPFQGELNPFALGAPKSSSPLGKVIAVTSAKGGTGKSSVAVTLAAYLAQASKHGPVRPLKVLLLDMDVRDGQIGFFTGFWKPTVMKILRFGISEKQIEDTVIHDEGLGVDVLLAPRRPRSSDELTPEFYEELIGKLRGTYDYIILDTSVNYLSPLMEKVALPQADRIVLLVENLNSTAYASARWIREVTSKIEFEGMGIPKDRISAILNKVRPGDDPEHSKKVIQNLQEIPIIGSIPLRSELFIDASNSQSMERVLEDPEIRGHVQAIVFSLVFGDISLDTFWDTSDWPRSGRPEVSN